MSNVYCDITSIIASRFTVNGNVIFMSQLHSYFECRVETVEPSEAFLPSFSRFQFETDKVEFNSPTTFTFAFHWRLANTFGFNQNANSKMKCKRPIASIFERKFVFAYHANRIMNYIYTTQNHLFKIVRLQWWYHTGEMNNNY